MSVVAIAGGTGLAGTAVAHEARERGHTVRVLSRGRPASPLDGVDYRRVDLVSGEGLPHALHGVDVLVDTSNGASGKARRVLTDGARGLARAAVAAGVDAAVLLSIANTARSAAGYHRAKAAQEQIYRSGPMPTSIVASTQFHDFPAMFLAAGTRLGLVPSFTGMSFQPIDVRDVARVLIDAVESPLKATRVIGGPETLTMDELSVVWAQMLAPRARVVRASLPRAIGAFFRSGDNLAPANAVTGIRFAQWVREQAPVTAP